MKLSQYLKQNNTTIKDFAEMVGINRSYLALCMNKKKRMGRHVAEKIEKFTHGAVTAQELMFPNKDDGIWIWQKKKVYKETI